MSESHGVQKSGLIQLPKIEDPRGKLSFVQNGPVLPFEIQRVYFTYDIPRGTERGGHAHINQEALIVPLSGSFEVCINEGGLWRTFLLGSPTEALYVAPMVWRELRGFSSGSICLVLSSGTYDEEDYIRDFPTFSQGLLQP